METGSLGRRARRSLGPRRERSLVNGVESAARPPRETDALQVVRRRERTYRWLLAGSDALVSTAAIALCISLLGDDHMRAASLLTAPLFILAAKVQGLYDRDELLIRKSTIDELPRLFQLATFFTLAMYLLDDKLFIGGGLGDAQLLGLWATLFTFTAVGRFGARKAAAAFSAHERCFLVGDAEVYARLQEKVGEWDSVDFVGSVPLEHVAGQPALLRALCRERDAHRLIIAPGPGGGGASTLDLVREAKLTGLRVTLVPGVLDVVGTTVQFDELAGMTLLGVPRFGLTKSSALVKRAFDVLGATIGVLVISPALIVAAIAIKLNSRGPVFFRQTRVGRDGERFQIVKFRTMVADADAMKPGLREHNEARDGFFKMADDPRTTPVGRLLRRFSLDELPQLFNVLAGEMSLVGPRPLVVDEDMRITGLDRRRLQLTPGMTGHWQILGSSKVPLQEMVKIDYLYVASWSLWSDVKILLRTVPLLAGGKGI